MFGSTSAATPTGLGDKFQIQKRKTNEVFGQYSSSSFPSTTDTTTGGCKTENGTSTTSTNTMTSSTVFGVPPLNLFSNKHGAQPLSSTSTARAKSGFIFTTPDASATTVTTSSVFTGTSVFGGFGFAQTNAVATDTTTTVSTAETNPVTTLASQQSCDSVILRPRCASGQPLVIDDIVGKKKENRVIGQLGVVMSSYIWKISNFNAICNSTVETVCTSPLFELGTREEAKPCKLFLYPNGSSALHKEHASIYLECQSNINGEAQISFSILNDTMQIIYQVFSSDLMSTDDQFPKIGCNQYVKKAFLLDPSNGLISNDTLTVMCHVSLRSMNAMPVFTLELKINKDFGHLFESQKFSDLTLEVEDKEFKVHRSILAARSPTLCKMIEDEDEQKQLKLTDVRYEVMEQILRFIYTEKVDTLNDIANELLDAANRFKLDDLKTLCEDTLIKNLNVDNAIDAHVMAEKYDAKWLKKKSADYIIENADKVINTSGYQRLAESHPSLLDKLFCKMVREKINHPIQTSVLSL